MAGCMRSRYRGLAYTIAVEVVVQAAAIIQVLLGVFGHAARLLAPLHAINALILLSVAFMAGRAVSSAENSSASAAQPVSV
jgi:hypothetical protein